METPRGDLETVSCAEGTAPCFRASGDSGDRAGRREIRCGVTAGCLEGTAALNGEELGASSCETLKADLISKNDLTHITCGTCSETKCNSSLPLNGPKLPLLLFGAVGLAFALVF